PHPQFGNERFGFDLSRSSPRPNRTFASSAGTLPGSGRGQLPDGVEAGPRDSLGGAGLPLLSVQFRPVTLRPGQKSGGTRYDDVPRGIEGILRQRGAGRDHLFGVVWGGERSAREAQVGDLV